MAYNAKSKRKKDFPCIRCSNHVKINDHAIQCALCDLWVHKECEKMSDETFKVLDVQNEENGRCFWSCVSCNSYARKFDKRMRDMEKRVTKLEETTVPKLNDDISGAIKDISDLKSSFKKLSEETKESQSGNVESVSSAVFDEFRERESRKCNVVVHNISESGAEVAEAEDILKYDKDKLQELCGVLSLDIDVAECARFVKRLGPRVEDSTSPRPLLVGFKNVETVNSVLQKAPKLAEKEEPWSRINVVKDITKIQRKEEKKLREDVVKKNAERTAEESENWEWKIVGRRGERKIVKVSIEGEEAATEGQEGEPIGNQTGNRGRGRGRGRGQRKSNRLQVQS